MAPRERRDRDDDDRDDRRSERRDDRDRNRDRDRGRDDDRGRDRDRGRGGRGGRTYSHHKQENVRRHSDQTGGSGESVFKSGYDTWRAKDGENAIRVLPPTWENYEHYGY